MNTDSIGFRSRIRPAILPASVAAWAFLSLGLAHAQVGAAPSTLNIESPFQCGGLDPFLRGNASGSDWLIGDQIEVFGTANARTSLGTLNGVFENVRCYSSSAVVEDRVFVSTAGGTLCGWVQRADLLAEIGETGPLAGGRGTTLCPTPRAMSFANFCSDLTGLSAAEVEACVGLPPAIRAKGVIVGATAGGDLQDYPFVSAPVNGVVISERSFFSILEVHRIAPGANGEVMALAGDGEGDIFGWIDLRAMELWPTRLGLFYDAEATGRMFQSEGDLISNWRFGDPSPDISPGLGPVEMADYIHGNLQLFSYPIVRTIRPSLDPAAGLDTDVDYHEVIFFGQTGEGSVTQLLNQIDIADQVAQLSRLNVMIVVDTTESMRPYLPGVQQGLTNFITAISALSRDPANNIPDMRVAVHAYSDFQTEAATGIDAPITMQRLMPPSRIGQFDLTNQLAGITAHRGLDDEVGLFFEAGFEAVTQLAESVAADDIWYEGSPTMVIHVADHGSRPSLEMNAVARRLQQVGAFYIPLVVDTDDANVAPRAAARSALEQQALVLVDAYVDAPSAADLSRVNAREGAGAVAIALQDNLVVAVLGAMDAIAEVRQSVLGDGYAPTSSDLVRDLASSRIDPNRFQIGEQVFADSGLSASANSMIVQASTAFAPLARADGRFAEEIDWTYTVALEAEETNFLRQSFTELCQRVGAPEQRGRLRQLIIELAEAFSGDDIDNEGQLLAVMSDLANMPGAENSFLAVPPSILLDRIGSSDPEVVERLRQDVCWISYHLGNTAVQLYARPNQLVWDGRTFSLALGEEATARTYRDRPIVGPELDYLPSFFFILPTQIDEGEAGPGWFD